MSSPVLHVPPGAASFVVAVVACVAVVAVVGCGSDRLATVPAQGTVRVDGKPVAGVQVVLHPINAGDTRLEKLRPTARTGSDGSFVIGTYEMADGAPVGEYVVTAEWFAGGPEKATSTSDDPEAAAAANATEVDRLGGRFANPETSPLKASVGRMSSSIAPFDLTTRAAKPPG
ncbi:MAG: hypothetical protein KJS77_01125 [Planctomycetes bacterium]|nr:hypothetical protein [Planctomycetota bacterium]